jgi:hypothetical protein
MYTKNRKIIFILFIAFPAILLLSLMNTGQTAQASIGIHCNLVLQHPITGQPCFQQELLDWRGTEMKHSPTVQTPLKWVLYVLCLSGKGGVIVNGYDAQMRLFTEAFPCDGKWHHEVFYPLEDAVFFGLSRPAELQVWTAL